MPGHEQGRCLHGCVGVLEEALWKLRGGTVRCFQWFIEVYAGSSFDCSKAGQVRVQAGMDGYGVGVEQSSTARLYGKKHGACGLLLGDRETGPKGR